MKKVLSILLVLMLVGAMMTTTAMAATEDGNTVLIKARSSQGGQIAMNDEGGEPVFNPDYPMSSAGENVTVGDTVAFSAKADEGYKFLGWLNEDTDETYSTDETIYIVASEALSLLAAFDRDVERVRITAEASLGGQIAMSDDGSDPEFNPDYPMSSAGGNIPVGDPVIFSAKANEGYKFICWMVKDTEELYSTEETITVTAEMPLTLVAVFDADIEKVLLKVNTEGKGQIAIDDEGGKPEFDPEYPMTSAFANVAPGDAVAVAAKADEGYKFAGWKDAATGKTVSTDEQYAVTVDKDMELIAVFEPTGSGKKDNTENTKPNTSKTSPKTGDPLPVVMLLMAVSLIGIAVSAVALTKKRKNEE